MNSTQIKSTLSDFQKYIDTLKLKAESIKEAGELEKYMTYKTAYERICDTANEMSESIALKYFGNDISYKLLIEMIDDAAIGFTKIGIKYNDIVAVSLLNSPSAVITFYALDKIGATMHMVNCVSGVEEIKRELNKIPSNYFILNDLFYSDELYDFFVNCGGQKMVCISLNEFMPNKVNKYRIKYVIAEKLKGTPKRKLVKKGIILFPDIIENGRKNRDIKVEIAKYCEDKNVAIAYTSGSTGESKAVVAAWKSIDSLVQTMAMTEKGRFSRGDVMLSTLPTWIFYSLLNMLHEPLVLGVALAFSPIFDATKIAELNNLYKFNHWLTAVVYLEQAIKADKKTDCSGWKIVLTGGSALGNDLKIQADNYIQKNGGSAKVAQGYGASEVLGSFAYGYIPNVTLGSVGVPCVGNMIRIVDIDSERVVNCGETGLCYVYSPAVMRGYYHDIESTNKVLKKDENGVIWYNTGDLVYQNEKQELFLVGRVKRMELTVDEAGNPAKLVPDEISRIISEIDYVDKCEVITVADEKVYNRPIAFVVLKDSVDSEELIKKNILDHCKKNLAAYKVPKLITFIDAIPMNSSSNKVNYKELDNIYIRQLNGTDET